MVDKLMNYENDVLHWLWKKGAELQGESDP